MSAAATAPDVAQLLETGNRAKREGRYRDALLPLSEATRQAPRQAATWLNRGVAHLELGQREEAVACFQRAVALEPFRPEAHNILGHALLLLGRCGSAAAHLGEAIRLRPGYAAACDNLARVLKTQGRSAEALHLHRAALAGRPSAATHSNLLYTMNLVDLPRQEVAAEHRRWGALYAPARGQAPAERSAASGGRLRVGFVSADFCHHAVAYFFEPVLEHHSRAETEIFCYSGVRAPDAVTERLRFYVEPDHWRDAAHWTDDELDQRIRADRLDVLIDLSGHTAGNRLTVFARRPAPVQATWLGYPNTTGVAAIDFRLTDAIADPEGDAFYSEKLVRLDGPFSCYRPPLEVSPPAATDRHGHPPVFGCFNHIAKYSDLTIGTWAELLRVVPCARLFLKSRGLADAATRGLLRGRFARHGIGSDQLILDGSELSVADHLALYRSVDVALDPFPYNGATTTCEALWMGVPVITLAGDAHAGRVGASLLTHAGFPEGIAASLEEYVTLAAAAATQRHDRADCRRRFASSPVCDGARFAANLERTLRQIAAGHR